MLRGMGDSKRPLYFIAIACVCNIVGDLVLVGVFHMGAAGAAIATVASQGISMLLAIVYLIRKKFLFDFKPKSFRLYREKVSTLLRLGAACILPGYAGEYLFFVYHRHCQPYGGHRLRCAGRCR